MKKHGMTLAQALQHVKSKRPVASPNAGFIRQLQDLEKSMRGTPCLYFSTHMHTLGLDYWVLMISVVNLSKRFFTLCHSE